MNVDVVVIGGGLAGLSTAWHLARRGQEVLVLEQREPGHEGGSSHGRARMTRSTYGSSVYVELVAEALAEDWAGLATHADGPLITPTPAVFFGPPRGLFGQFADATLSQGVSGLTQLGAHEGARRWPQLAIAPEDGVILDQTAGVISAARTIQALRKACDAEGVIVRVSAAVRGIEDGGAQLEVLLAGDCVRAQRVVVAAGAFTGELLPELRSVIRPLRQVVGYAAPSTVDAPAVNWARLDAGLTYGLPPHEGDGAKMAGHRLDGPPDDPRAVAPVDDADRARLRTTLEPALRVVPASSATRPASTG